MFKSAGYRTGPSAIENCLRQHTAVAKVAVAGSPDAARGPARSARPCRVRSRRTSGPRDSGENALDALPLARDGTGQRHRTGRPLQQPRPETILQRRHQPCNPSRRAAGAKPRRSATATKACMASKRSMVLFHILQ